MFHQKLKELYYSAVSNVVSNISNFAFNPHSDFTRSRKLPAHLLISFLVSQGASSTGVELLDFFDFSGAIPTVSALNQQRSKLKPQALEAVLKQFNSMTLDPDPTSPYRFLAADGSTFAFFSNSSFASADYYVSEGHSAKGFYNMHLNAFFDLQRHIYTDAILQPVHNKDEFRAFCDMADRQDILPGIKNVYIGDRGYCSYHNMAHVIESGQHFLFRSKDIHSKGLVGKFDFPDRESFDIPVKVTLVRSNSKKLIVTEGYKRFVDQAASFDFITYGSMDTYELSFRVVRFPLSDSSYECIVTNLPEDEFPMERIKQTYFSRWGIESSFRKLKYTIGLSSFHSYKPDYIQQEIWAKMLAYNITELMVRHTVIEKRGRKHSYQVNFTMAVHICRVFLRLTTEKDSIEVMSLLKKELLPIRNERQYPRLKTAHFRKPRYFIYRAA